MTASPNRIDTPIFGVGLDEVPAFAALRSVCEGFLDQEKTRSIYTPNPEILLYARDHPDYAALLNEADLALPDGFGIVLVHLLRHAARIHKWAGIDVAELILASAARRSARVMFLGGRDGIGDRAAAFGMPGAWMSQSFPSDGLRKSPAAWAERNASCAGPSGKAER